LTAALKEGLGITVLAKSTVPNELNYQLQTKRLPELGQIGISLIKRADQPDNAADKLAEFIALRLT
jgi:DNA-binding transcriptional LysR family regulator